MSLGCVFFLTASSRADAMDAHMDTRLFGRGKVVGLGCRRVTDHFRPNPKTI